MRPEINQYIESHQDEMVQDLQRVIRTRSVIDTSAENMPYGKGCAQMLEQILEMCSAMAKMGRVWSNWMIQVLPTNKKLIDRSTRIIAELAGIPYEQACEEFFKSYLSRPKDQEYRESYVVETLRRLGVEME